MFKLFNKNKTQNIIKSYMIAPLVLTSQNNEISVTANLIQLGQEANIIIPLIFLWVFFGLFMLFNVFFSFAAILLITEAAMLTLILLLTVSLTTYFPNLTADVLNLLNASAMEAIIGITIVFVHQKSWKSRHTNNTNNVLESSLGYFCGPYLTKDRLLFCAAIVHCAYKMYVAGPTFIYCWILQMFMSVVNFFTKPHKQQTALIGYSENNLNSYKQHLKNSFQASMCHKQVLNSVKLGIRQKQTNKSCANVINSNNLNNKIIIKSLCQISKRAIHTKKVKSTKILKHLFNTIIISVNCRIEIKPKFYNQKLIKNLQKLTLMLLVFCGIFLNYQTNVPLNLDGGYHEIIHIWDMPVSKLKNISELGGDGVSEVLNFNIKLKLNLRHAKNRQLNDFFGSPIHENIEKVLQKANERLSNIANQSIANQSNINPKDILIDFKKIVLNQKNWVNRLTNQIPIMDPQVPAQFYQIHQITGRRFQELAETNNLIERSFQFNLLKKKYNGGLLDQNLNTYNLWTKIPFGEKLENQITRVTSQKLDSFDRSEIREKMLKLVKRGELGEFNQSFLIKKSKELYDANGVTEVNYKNIADKLIFPPPKNIRMETVMLDQLNRVAVVKDLSYFENKVNFSHKQINKPRTLKGETIFSLKYLKRLSLSLENMEYTPIRPIKLISKNNVRTARALEENTEIYVCYTKAKENLNWSGKNWDTIFTYQSKLLPWYENADIEDDDMLDDTSLGGQQIFLSEKLKETTKSILWSQAKKVNISTEVGMSTDLPNLRGELQKYFSLKSLHTNTDILQNLELSYKTLSIKLEGLDLSHKLKIMRNPLNFPVSSPRTMNHFDKDTLFSINSTIYTKGGSQTPLTVMNKEGVGTEERINLVGNGLNTPINNRLFSFSSSNRLTGGPTDISLEILGNGLGLTNNSNNKRNTSTKSLIIRRENTRLNAKKEINSSLWDDDGADDNEPYSTFRFRILNTKQKKHKLKLLLSGNSQKINQTFYNRKDDIMENRKIVENRMIKPIKDLLYQRAGIAEERVTHVVKRLPQNEILNFIEKNERLRDGPDFDEALEYFQKQNYDSLLGIRGSLAEKEKIVFDDDFEIDVENLRTTAAQPHSLYGLLWDEYLKQTYNVSLQFLDFNRKFDDYYKSQLKVINFNYTDNLEKALDSDLRYTFTINDEIKNTLIGKMFPKIGYFSEVNNPSAQYLDLGKKHKKGVLLHLKEYFYTGRAYKKKLKKYISRRIKYGEKPFGFKYDQLPHQLKLPYRKKLLWVHGGFDKQIHNFGFKTNSHLLNKNKLDSIPSRYRQTLPYGDTYAKIPKLIKKSHHLPMYTFKGSLGRGLGGGKVDYNRDKFTNGVEFYYDLKNQLKYDDREIQRISTQKNKSALVGNTGYIFDRTKSGIWQKKKHKMRIKKNIRTFTKYFLHKTNIFETRGTNKYQNDNYFFDLVEKYRLGDLRSEKKYDSFDDYTNPIVNLIRSGDIDIEKNILRESHLSKYRFNLFKNKKVENTPAVDQLDNFRLAKLSKNFFNNSLTPPEGLQENQLYSLNYYTELNSQGLNYGEDWGIFDNVSTNIIKDSEEYYLDSPLGFAGHTGNNMTLASFEENILIFSEQEIVKGSGPSNPTRNYYTYFSTSPWDITENLAWNKKYKEISQKESKKINTFLQKFDKIFMKVTEELEWVFIKIIQYIIKENNTEMEINKILIKFKLNTIVWKLNIKLIVLWFLNFFFF